MNVAGIYSFNGGREVIEECYPNELAEVLDVIRSVDSSLHKTKVSKEKTMPGRMLFDPTALNQAFKTEFHARDWRRLRVFCEYPANYYVPGYTSSRRWTGAFREMDYVKNRLGIEVQLGKYAFMVYNVCAKMTIFHNLGHIDAGIEIVPLKQLADEMSSGVSYFEQFVWDLETRGVADIDIPVLILGLAP